MQNNYGVFKYIEELNRQVQAQNKQIYQMNRIIQQLQNNVYELENEIMSLKEKPSTTIEKIEYKFDQLKVETLEGTLNIGLTPNGDGKSIDDFAVDTKQLTTANSDVQQSPQNQQFNGLYKSLNAQTNSYLNQECKQVIEALEQKYNFPLQPQYRDFIINDIKKQIGDRIKYYINHHARELENPQRIGSVEQSILKKIKEDINNSVEVFIQNLPRGIE
jgi:spore germination protein PC